MVSNPIPCSIKGSIFLIKYINQKHNYNFLGKWLTILSNIGTEEQNKALLKTGGFKGYSITDELNAIGVESDFESRKKLYQDTFSSSSVPLSPSLTVAPVIADTFASKLGLEKIDFKHSKQTSNIYIDSNFLGLSVFINRNYRKTKR